MIAIDKNKHADQGCTYFWYVLKWDFFHPSIMLRMYFIYPCMLYTKYFYNDNIIL